MIAAAGEKLREARELKGLTVEDIAARLRIPAHYVRALEQGDLPTLPEPTFVRGYVKSYARELGLEVEPLVAALAPAVEVKVPQPLLAVDGGSSGRKASARSPNFRGGGASRRRPLLIAAVAVVVLLGVTVLLIVPRDDSATPPTVALAVPASTASAEPPVSLPSVPVVSGPAVETAIALPPPPSAQPQPPAELPAASPAPASAVALPVPAPAAPAAAPVEKVEKEIAAPRHGLYIRFRGDSWVEVRDADNVVLHTSMQSSGSALSQDGKAPLTVTLGDASAADVWYNGVRQPNRGGSARVTRLIVGQAAR